MLDVLFLMYADTDHASLLYHSILNTELQSNSNPFHHEAIAVEQKTVLDGKDFEGSPAEKMVLICASIVANPIQKVLLSSENLDDQLVIFLAAALRNCSSLTTLDLSYNDFGPKGVISLAVALPNCPALTTLNLVGNEIGNEGAISLAAALPNCPALTTLKLNGNRIGNEGAISLAARGVARLKKTSGS